MQQMNKQENQTKIFRHRQQHGGYQMKVGRVLQGKASQIYSDGR